MHSFFACNKTVGILNKNCVEFLNSKNNSVLGCVPWIPAYHVDKYGIKSTVVNQLGPLDAKPGHPLNLGYMQKTTGQGIRKIRSVELLRSVLPWSYLVHATVNACTCSSYDRIIPFFFLFLYIWSRIVQGSRHNSVCQQLARGLSNAFDGWIVAMVSWGVMDKERKKSRSVGTIGFRTVMCFDREARV